jgi:GTPase SAR1 family protein
VPVILVGNKIDLRGGQVTNEALEDEIIPIMNEFKVCVLHYETFLTHTSS